MIRDYSDQDTPPGYRLYTRYLGHKDRRTGLAIELLLDVRLIEELDEQAKRLRKQEIVESEEREAAERRERDARFEAKAAKPYKKDGIDFDFDAELEAAVDPVPGKDYDVKSQHPVYPAARLVHWMQDSLSGTPDRDLQRRDYALFQKLKERGPLRRLAVPEDATFALDALRQSQLHFGAVIDLVAAQLALARRSAHPFALAPILLVGEAGVGKTHFAFELARALGTGFHRQAFDSEQTSSALLGSDRKWANTAYGIVFEQVVLGEFANPVVVLDEVDKARREYLNGQDPLASLLTLLEPVTRGCVRDISTRFEFDASQIIWIATANDATRLSAPLRSRFREFHIALPTPEQALQMAPGIVRSVIESLALEDFEPPGHEIAVRVAHLSPREIRQAIEPAVGHALANGRRNLAVSDLPKELQDASADSAGQPLLH